MNRAIPQPAPRCTPHQHVQTLTGWALQSGSPALSQTRQGPAALHSEGKTQFVGIHPTSTIISRISPNPRSVTWNGSVPCVECPPLHAPCITRPFKLTRNAVAFPSEVNTPYRSRSSYSPWNTAKRFIFHQDARVSTFQTHSRLKYYHTSGIHNTSLSKRSIGPHGPRPPHRLLKRGHDLVPLPVERLTRAQVLDHEGRHPSPLPLPTGHQHQRARANAQRQAGIGLNPRQYRIR